MPGNYGTVSRRFLETLEKSERSPILKAAAAVSDAAMVEQAGQQAGAPPAGQPMLLPDELYQMAQDPQLSPAERATVLQAAERINMLTAPVEPEAPPQGAQPGQVAPGQPQEPQPSTQPEQGAVPGEKSAAETDPDYDFGDIIPAKQANSMFHSASTSEGVMSWLRERSGH